MQLPLPKLETNKVNKLTLGRKKENFRGLLCFVCFFPKLIERQKFKFQHRKEKFKNKDFCARIALEKKNQGRICK